MYVFLSSTCYSHFHRYIHSEQKSVLDFSDIVNIANECTCTRQHSKSGVVTFRNMQTSKISWINTLALRSGCQSVRRMARVKNCVYRFCILKKPYFILNIRCEICMECMSGMRISCTPVCSKLVANVLTL